MSNPLLAGHTESIKHLSKVTPSHAGPISHLTLPCSKHKSLQVCTASRVLIPLQHALQLWMNCINCSTHLGHAHMPLQLQETLVAATKRTFQTVSLTLAASTSRCINVLTSAAQHSSLTHFGRIHKRPQQGINVLIPVQHTSQTCPHPSRIHAPLGTSI